MNNLMLSMCRTLIFKTPGIMKREELRLRIEGVKMLIYLCLSMNISPEDEVLKEYRKELNELELQLSELQLDIYRNASS